MLIKSVYIISHPETKEIVYVGCTKNIDQRALVHENSITDLGNWIKNLIELNLKPVYTIAEMAPEYGYSEIERKWILKYHQEGCKLFNKHIPGISRKHIRNFIIINSR